MNRQTNKLGMLYQNIQICIRNHNFKPKITKNTYNNINITVISKIPKFHTQNNNPTSQNNPLTPQIIPLNPLQQLFKTSKNLQIKYQKNKDLPTRTHSTLHKSPSFRALR